MKVKGGRARERSSRELRCRARNAVMDASASSAETFSVSSLQPEIYPRRPALGGGELQLPIHVSRSLYTRPRTLTADIKTSILNCTTALTACHTR